MAPTTRPPVVLLPEDRSSTRRPDVPGWRARDGFDLPDAPWDLAPRRWLCVGSVSDATEAEAAIQALSRGVGLAIVLGLTGELRLRTLEDLHRLGDLAPGAGADQPVLDPDHRALLDALAQGMTVTGAARSLHVSRRTANRRLAEARELLGVTSTAEAISRWTTGR